MGYVGPIGVEILSSKSRNIHPMVTKLSIYRYGKTTYSKFELYGSHRSGNTLPHNFKAS